MLNQHGFDSVMCPVKLKRNQIYDDSVHCKHNIKLYTQIIS